MYIICTSYPTTACWSNRVTWVCMVVLVYLLLILVCDMPSLSCIYTVCVRPVGWHLILTQQQQILDAVKKMLDTGLNPNPLDCNRLGQILVGAGLWYAVHGSN
jgi:hypothetical protein